MKTLKYLVLLLVVAIALPAVAQEKLTKALKVGDEKVTEIKDKGTKKGSTETTGVFGKITYKVAVDATGALVATATTNTKKTVIGFRKDPVTGALEKLCATNLKGTCPNDYTYVGPIPDDKPTGPEPEVPIAADR